MEMGSEQVAGVLRASGSRVRLVVARAADPAAPPLPHHKHPAHPAPLVPARYVLYAGRATCPVNTRTLEYLIAHACLGLFGI